MQKDIEVRGEYVDTYIHFWVKKIHYFITRFKIFHYLLVIRIILEYMLFNIIRNYIDFFIIRIVHISKMSWFLCNLYITLLTSVVKIEKIKKTWEYIVSYFSLVIFIYLLRLIYSNNVELNYKNQLLFRRFMAVEPQISKIFDIWKRLPWF